MYVWLNQKKKKNIWKLKLHSKWSIYMYTNFCVVNADRFFHLPIFQPFPNCDSSVCKIFLNITGWLNSSLFWMYVFIWIQIMFKTKYRQIKCSHRPPLSLFFSQAHRGKFNRIIALTSVYLFFFFLSLSFFFFFILVIVLFDFYFVSYW